MDVKYYECHITIEPVFDARLLEFQTLCISEKFRVAKLLMQKNRQETEARSNKDSFCTGHATSYEDMESRMYRLIETLKMAGFSIWRYKIEAIILDQRLSG